MTRGAALAGDSMWTNVATAVRRWLDSRARRRPLAALPRMSAEWLRQHELESSKHQQDL